MAAASDPTGIAREALRRLVARQIVPTPDNYRKLYDEIAGVPGDAAGFDAEAMLSWADLIRELLKQWETKRGGLTTAKKREGLDRVLIRFAADPAALYAKLQVLVKSWSTPLLSPPKEAALPLVEDRPDVPVMQPAPGSTSRPSILDSQSSIPTRTDDIPGQLRELLVETLESGLVQQLGHVPALAEEARALAHQVRTARDSRELSGFAAGLKQFCFKLGLQGEDGVKLQQGLLRLFNLLMENIVELLGDDQWLRGQIAVLREIISSPLDLQVIDRAEHGLKQVIFRQGVLKHNLDEAKRTLKSMVTRFIDRVGELSETTGEYHDKIDRYSQKISRTEDIGELNQLLTEVMRETRNIQSSALRSRDELVAARKKVETAQAKIKQLEVELEQLSEKVREDQLTGTLNRRGLDDAFEREAARADRQQSPLCLALLDIDNFKDLNDIHGHQTGDDALVYLVGMAKETIRPNDIVARFGGEEFLVLLPDTGMDEAVSVIARLQRNLTRKIFLHKSGSLLITFSAGVAQRVPAETQDAVVARADKALYRAKQAGKNRVFAAQ